MKHLFTKNFYKYILFKIRRAKPLDYIFIDWPVLMFFLMIFILGILLFFPYKFELKLPLPENQVSLLESLLRTIAILIGISFSFIILSFNIFYRYFGRYAFLDFFKSRIVKICITLLFTTITLLSYSIYFIKEANENNGYTMFLFFFSILISITSFFSIFPCFIILLRNSQNRTHIIKLFEKLNEEWSLNKFIAKIENQLPSFYQQDPINILNEIGLMSIKESDNFNIELITDNMIIFFRENISNKSQDKYYVEINDIYHRFNDVLENFYFLAIKEKNENILVTIVHTIFRIENIILENINQEGFEFALGHGDKYRYLNLNFTVEKFLKKALQASEDSVCQEILENYSYFVNSVIIKLFPENINYTGSNRFDIIQLCDVVFDPLTWLVKFVEFVISAKKVQLCGEIFSTFNTIENKVLDLKTTNSTKCFLFNVIHNYKREGFEKYIDANDSHHISYLNFPFKEDPYFLEKTGCKTTYLGSLEILDLTFSKNKLNNVVINIAKAGMLHLIHIKNEDLLQKGIEKFAKLASLIQENDNNYRKDVYLKLLENLQVVQKSAIEQSASQKILDLLKSNVELFHFKNKFRIDLEQAGFVTDERII